jgi:hypothetical protein
MFLHETSHALACMLTCGDVSPASTRTLASSGVGVDMGTITTIEVALVLHPFSSLGSDLVGYGA